MPHVIVEYTTNAVEAERVPGLLDAVHRAVFDSGMFEPDHIKSRALPITDYRCGTDDRPFIHVQLRIRPGRDTEQKRYLSQAVLAAIRDRDAPARVVTVEVVELDAASYAKYEV
jgi:5-carboxymethyl-2-hydroxymuconate isomerase